MRGSIHGNHTPSRRVESALLQREGVDFSVGLMRVAHGLLAVVHWLSRCD